MKDSSGAGTVVVARGHTATGAALAGYFRRTGWRVAVLGCADAASQSPEPAENREHDDSVVATTLDLTDAAAVDAAAAAIEASLGPIDLWIHNAIREPQLTAEDIVHGSPVHESPEAARRATEICHQAFLNGTLAALRRMKARGRGHFIHLGAAPRRVRSWPGVELDADVQRLDHFIESVRRDLRQHGHALRLTCVRVPADAMRAVPTQRILAAVAEACARRRREIWVRPSALLGVPSADATTTTPMWGAPTAASW